MKLDQECILLQNELKKFSQQVLLEKVDELDKNSVFPEDNIKQLAEMGILGALIPEQFGGAALNLIGFVVSLEELAKVCASTASIVAVHNALFVYPILKFGNDALKKKYLTPAASGEIIGAAALATANEVSLSPQNSNIVVNGYNPLLLNGEAQGPFISFFPYHKEDSEQTICAIIDKNQNTVTRTKNNNILGLKAAGISKVNYNDLKITTESLVGKDNQGNEIMQSTYDFANVCFAAIALGIAQGALQEALKYARQRVQFDQPIINFGMVREKIVETTTMIEAGRNLIYDAALKYDAGENYRQSASIARYFTGNAAIESTIQAIQIFGGYGYMKDYPVERYLRDAQVINVLGRTPIQEKEVIAQEIIG